jgi:reactive intermediate/imine deaminase
MMGAAYPIGFIGLGTMGEAMALTLSLVTGLAEAVHFADRHGLNLNQLMAVLNGGPMASDVSRVKAPKLVGRDFAVQATISNVLENSRLIAEAVREAGVASPLLDVCHALYGETRALGFGDADMAAVLKAIEARSDRRARTSSSKEPPELLLRPPQRIAESCVVVIIIVIIMKWRNCLFSVIKSKEFVLLWIERREDPAASTKRVVQRTYCPQEFSMSKTAITSPELAPPVGPFSQAVDAGGFIYFSGQVGQDPTTGKLVAGGIAAETDRLFQNLSAVLKAAGKSFDDVVRVGVFLTSMSDYVAMNGMYAKHFRQPFPARTTIGVAALPLGACVEIDLVVKA